LEEGEKKEFLKIKSKNIMDSDCNLKHDDETM